MALDNARSISGRPIGRPVVRLDDLLDDIADEMCLSNLSERSLSELEKSFEFRSLHVKVEHESFIMKLAIQLERFKFALFALQTLCGN